MPKLSICIPTYNRVDDLKACMKYLMPQVECLLPDLVEVVIVNNASIDETRDFINVLAAKHNFVRVFHNENNIGLDGNTVKCIEYANGNYTAILSDDDRYTSGTVQAILDVIEKDEYAQINLNYYSFLGDRVDHPCNTFAPNRDMEFARAFDILNYPSVGHFSGFVYNTALAKKALADMCDNGSIPSAENATESGRRGTYLEIAVRIAANTTLPAYFIGARKVAVKVQVDHNTVPMGYLRIREICIDYYYFMERLYKEGLLTDSDFEYRRTLVLSWLPGMIARNAAYANCAEFSKIAKEMSSVLGEDVRYRRRVAPILSFACNPMGRVLLCYLVRFRDFFRKYAAIYHAPKD